MQDTGHEDLFGNGNEARGGSEKGYESEIEIGRNKPREVMSERGLEGMPLRIEMVQMGTWEKQSENVFFSM